MNDNFDDYRLFTNEEMHKWANEEESLRQKIQELRDSYEVVFIPGILGSCLKIGNYEFGKDRIDCTKLVLSEPNQHAEPQIMNQFSSKGWLGGLIKREDVYGKGLELLNYSLGGKNPRTFAYDWRLDIAVIAEQFQEFAKRNLKGKRVIVVAHSMGGLVAWHWKNTHLNENDRPFIMVDLILVGSPLQGSCEIIKTLIRGYELEDSAAWYQKDISKFVFSKAQAAFFTFPSVFELIPKYGKCNCLSREFNGYPLPMDPFEFGTWHQDSGHSVIRKFCTDTGLTEKEYRRLIELALQTAKKFHVTFDPRRYEDSVHFLYSSSTPMESEYIIENDGKDWLRIKEQSSSPSKRGDGRVLSESALNKCTETSMDYPQYYHLPKEVHGSLLKDDQFVIFVRDNLMDEIETRIRIESTGGYVLNDTNLKQKFYNRRWLSSLLITDAKLDLDPKIAEAQQTIAQFNASVTTETAVASEQHLIGYAAQMEQQGHRDIASVLLETSLFLDPSTVRPEVLNKLATLQLGLGDRHSAIRAISVLNGAKKIADETNDHSMLAEIETNLGQAYTAYTKINIMAKPLIQLTLDSVDYDATVKLAEQTAPYVDIFEVGTPCIKHNGVNLVKELRAKFPHKSILVDLKIMDAGEYEATPFYAAGADICTVLGVSGLATCQGVIKAANAHGAEAQIDLINVEDKVACARATAEAGAHIMGIHTGFDAQATGHKPFSDLNDIAALGLPIRISVAGGIKASTVQDAVRAGANIIVIGPATYGASSPAEAVREIRELVDAV